MSAIVQAQKTLPEPNVVHMDVLKSAGIHIPKDAKILDFGCGAGDTVRALHELGYLNAIGYEIDFEGVSLLDPEARPSYVNLGSQMDLRLPFPDDNFDLIISDQVFEHVQDQATALRELHRITKRGGHALHVSPSRYRPIEAHIYVPFGGVIAHRWHYKFWALIGVRNEHQRGLDADEVADRNASFFVYGLRYIPTSCYRALCKSIGYRFSMPVQAYFDSHERSIVRLLGRVNRVFPIVGWLYSTFHTRLIQLVKL